jgi:hypothetical protein
MAALRRSEFEGLEDCDWPIADPRRNLLASGVVSPDGNDAWTASVGIHGQEGPNFYFCRRVREARIDWFCNLCTVGGKLDVIVRTLGI